IADRDICHDLAFIRSLARHHDDNGINGAGRDLELRPEPDPGGVCEQRTIDECGAGCHVYGRCGGETGCRREEAVGVHGCNGASCCASFVSPEISQLTAMPCL